MVNLIMVLRLRINEEKIDLKQKSTKKQHQQEIINFSFFPREIVIKDKTKENEKYSLINKGKSSL